MIHEIEQITARTWLLTGTIWIVSLGEENTYYADEFGLQYYCKNRV